MPPIVVSDPGEVHLLKRSILGPLAPPSIWHLRVFVNNYVPLRNVLLSNLVEASWSGYAPVVLDPMLWTTVQSVGGVATTYYTTSPTLFTPFSGMNNTYGYYLTFDNGAELLWVQRFDLIPTVAQPSDPLRVWPIIQGHSESQPV